MFAYCGNNPVNRRDGNGNAWEDVKKWFSKRWNAFKNFVGNTFENEKTSVFVEDSTPAVDISNLIPASMTVGNRTSTQKKPFLKSKPIMTYGQVRGDFIFASSCGVKINFKNQYYDLSYKIFMTLYEMLYRILPFHSPHKSGPHQQWHWQRNTWNPKTGGITGRSIHWTLFGRRF